VTADAGNTIKDELNLKSGALIGAPISGPQTSELADRDFSPTYLRRD
jgi:hypothetical protein